MKKTLTLSVVFLSLALCCLSCTSGSDTYTSEQDESSSIKDGITYTLYHSHASSIPLYVITGKKGDKVPTLPVPVRKFYEFKAWRSDDNEELPLRFGSEGNSFYATWSSSTQIGTKIRPNVVGDIVFTDGSATPYTDVITTPLTDDQKEQVAAIIYTTTYNKENGDNKNGSTMLGIAVRGKNTYWCRKKIEVNSSSSDVLLSLYAGYDIQNGTAAQILSLNPYDGSKNLVKTNQLLAYAETYAPAFYYAYTYGTRTIEMDEAYRDGWYLPSRVEVFVLMNDIGLRNTISNIFNLVGQKFDANANVTAKTQSTMLLTSYADNSEQDSVSPNDYGGQYSESDEWVTLRLYDITAELTLRDKTPYVNPLGTYKKAAIYTKCYAYDFSGKENVVKKNIMGYDQDKKDHEYDDAVYKTYAYPVRVFY